MVVFLGQSVVLDLWLRPIKPIQLVKLLLSLVKQLRLKLIGLLLVILGFRYSRTFYFL
jgi:hypothetical protein